MVRTLKPIVNLIKNGIDCDMAFSLDRTEIEAFTIAFGELEGGMFDYEAGVWRKRDEIG